MAAQHYLLTLASELSAIGRVVERIDLAAGRMVFISADGVSRTTVHARWKRGRLVIDERTIVGG